MISAQNRTSVTQVSFLYPGLMRIADGVSYSEQSVVLISHSQCSCQGNENTSDLNHLSDTNLAIIKSYSQLLQQN